MEKMNFMYKFNKIISNIKKTCKASGAVILAVVMSFSLVACSFSRDRGSSITPGSAILPIASKPVQPSESAANPNQIAITGVLTYVDRASGKMHYMDIESGNEYEVLFDGGTDIRSKYDTIITSAKLKLGTIYDVVCNRTGWAISVLESKKAWKISQFTGFSLDEQDMVATLNSQTYRYSKSAVVLSEGGRIQPSEIMKQDVVTACGIDRTVYSINVDKGHGYLKLTGVDNFVGGYVDVGTTIIDVISKDMLITVPEGEYKVLVQNMNRTLEGSKSVKIERDKDVTLDFSEYVAEAVKNGTVEFSVTPAGAVMYIDGMQVSYDKPITLDYGRHTVVLRANNYLVYEEVFYVRQEYEKKIIDMSISRSNETTRNASTQSASGQAQSRTYSTSSAKQSSAAVNGTMKNLTEGYYVHIKEPQGAAVYVNNSYVGMAPVSVEKKAGTMVIALTMAGRQTKSYSVNIPNATGDLNYSFPALELNNPVGEVSTTGATASATETTAPAATAAGAGTTTETTAPARMTAAQGTTEIPDLTWPYATTQAAGVR